MNQATTTIISHSPDQTFNLGRQFASQVQPGTAICLIGDLGAGKTQFVKGFAKGLGIPQTITSSTFLLFQQYTLPPKTDDYTNKNSNLYLNHLDLYRVDGDPLALGFDLLELITDNQYTLIEWADHLADYLPGGSMEIHFSYIDDQTRQIIHPPLE